MTGECRRNVRRPVVAGTSGKAFAVQQSSMAEHDPSPPSFRRPVALGRAVVRHALVADVPFMAGAIAYQAFISILPFLFLLVVVTTTVGGVDLTDRLLDVTTEQLPADAQGIVREAVRSAVEQTGNSIVGVLVLGFGAVAVFNGLDKAFTDLYGVDRGATLPDQLRDAAVVLAAFGMTVLTIAGVWRLGALSQRLPAGGLLRAVLLTVAFVVALYPMFYVFPEVSLGWREVLPGVAVTAVGWTVLQTVFGLYVRFVLRSEAFGVVSGILLLATWLYFSGFVLLVGGALNAVLHGRGRRPEAETSDAAPDESE